MELVLLNPDRYPEAEEPRHRPWLEALLGELAPRADSFSVRFSDDPIMRDYNRRFRDIDATTDVLSFPGEAHDEEGLHLGDVVISVPTARRQAAEAGCPVDEELRRLLLHGVLHCLGFDHETDDGTMERLEDRLTPRWVTQVPHRLQPPPLEPATGGEGATP